MKHRKKRKYLNDLGKVGNCLDAKPNGRAKSWKKQQMIYGFDERETWSLDATMIELLYERILMYQEVNIVDTEYRQIEINGESKTQEAWMNTLIDLCKKHIEKDGWECLELQKEIWSIWAELSPSMWW